MCCVVVPLDDRTGVVERRDADRRVHHVPERLRSAEADADDVEEERRDDAAVAEDRQLLTASHLGEVRVERGARAHRRVPPRLAAADAHVIATDQRGDLVRELLEDLAAFHALPATDVDLAQARVELGLDPERACRVARARQVRADDADVRHVAQPLGRACRLQPPVIAERRVTLALPSPVGVRLRLAVTNEGDAHAGSQAFVGFALGVELTLDLCGAMT